MKKNLLIIEWCVVVLLSACGGGGGGGDPSSTVDTNSSTSLHVPVASVALFGPGSLDVPKNLLLVGSALYVADTSGLTVLDSAGAVNNTYNVTNAIGIGTQSGYIYHTGKAANGYDTVFQLGSVTGLVATSASNNFDGIAFYGTTQQFVANNSNILTYTNFANPVPVTNLPGTPVALASDVTNAKVYASFNNSDVLGSIDPANLNAGVSILTQAQPAKWGPVSRPSGIAVVGDYAYVVSSGTVAGDHGYISKIHTGTGATEVLFSETVGTWGSVPAGFCGASGIAVDSTGSAIYVANGTCSPSSVGYANRNRLLKISIS